MSRNMLACLAGRQSCGRAGPDHSSPANQPRLSPASTLAAPRIAGLRLNSVMSASRTWK